MREVLLKVLEKTVPSDSLIQVLGMYSREMEKDRKTFSEVLFKIISKC